jgi:hypothetical protein
VLAKRKTKLMAEAEANKAERARVRVARVAKKALKEVGWHAPDHRDVEVERSLRRVGTHTHGASQDTE